MKLIFWGTSHGLPEKGRYCSCTMLEVDGNIYFIDAGAPLSDIMVNNDILYEKVKSIFITHAHLDHSAGLPMFMSMEKWFFPNSSTQIYLPDENIYNGLAPILEDAVETTNNKVQLHIYKGGTFYDDGVIKVEAIPTLHMSCINRLTYAFKISTEKNSILFTGDLSDDFRDFPNIAAEEDLDAIVCELTHYDVESAIPKMNLIKAKKMIFNHVRDDKIKIMRNNKEKLNFEYHFANDGDIIII